MIGKSLLLLLAFMTTGASAAATLKLATLAPEGTGWMRELRGAGETIKERTQGRVLIKFFPGGVMGNDVAVLRKITLGQLQGGAFSGSELSNVFPSAQIYSMPFLFESLDEVGYVRERVDPLIRDGLLRGGFVVVGMSGGGFAYLMSTRPISTKNELRATKVWAMQNDRIAQVAFSNGGVNPVTLPLGDVYTSLQTGLLETVAITTSGAIAFQWHTKVRHVVDLPLSYVAGMLAIDQKAFAKISADDQQVVRDAFENAFRNLDASGVADNVSARAVLEKQGIAFHRPDPDEVSFWRSIGDLTLQQMLADGSISAEIVAAIRKAQTEFRTKSTAKDAAKP